MCGISGIIDILEKRPIDRARLERMNDLLAHRGPDGAGTYFAPGIGLAHRRLAVVDLEGGRQPLANDDGSVIIVFNGEIYNFIELRTELAQRGRPFHTRSDTEVIIRAWEEWGEDCLSRLTGMFAFALVDFNLGTLFLARDRFGEKPLYYTISPEGFLIFASELASLIAALPRRPELDPQAIEDYLALGYVPDPKTIFRDVRKLPPAHSISADLAKPVIQPHRYWNLAFGSEPAHQRTTAAEELIARLRGAVKQRMISDVPLGAFLSGGVDSSGIVALMAESSPQPVRTCSVGFDEPSADETAYAAAVAARYATRHSVERVQVDATDLIDTIAATYGEPFADSSALPTYRVCALARRHVTVALSGDGGDEVFAGYRRHRFHLREEQFKAFAPAAVRQPVFSVLAHLYPKLDWAPRPLRAKATFEALAEDAVGGYFRAVSAIPTPIRHQLYSGDFRRSLNGYSAIEVLREHAAAAGTSDPLSRIQYLDFKTWLPGAMLTKVDRASMAHGLEVRVPFLDHRLVEWAARLPTDLKVSGSQGKAILKKALEPYLPHDILYRPKQGFAPPIAAWLRGDMAGRLRTVLHDSPLTESGLFDMSTVKRLAAEHTSGRRDHARVLWSLVMFDAFLRQEWRTEGPAQQSAIRVA